MTLIDRLSKLDGPDRETELLRMYQDEKQRADSMSDDWVNFCNYIGIDLDTQEAVAEAINVARHKDQVEHNELNRKAEMLGRSLIKMVALYESEYDADAPFKRPDWLQNALDEVEKCN